MNLNVKDFVTNDELWASKPPGIKKYISDRQNVRGGPVYCLKTVCSSCLELKQVTGKSQTDWRDLVMLYGEIHLTEVVAALANQGIFEASEWCKTSIKCATVPSGHWVLCDGYSINYKLPKPLGKQTHIALPDYVLPSVHN